MLRLLQFLLFIPIILVYGSSPTLKINQGQLQGRYELSGNGIEYSAFTGIPFAKPPLGKRRFKIAEPADSWNGTYDATKPHAACPQNRILYGNTTIFGDEDCLYLNVYSPMNSTNDITEPKAVMFFIYGGGLFSGDANFDSQNPKYFMDHDVLVVMANYRLGPLGFLTTGDDAAPPNLALRDQHLAIQWTRENIGYFGGDLNKITVFGESAGSACVHLQSLSPYNKGLIHGYISESGTALSPWALWSLEESIKRANILGEHFNCTTNSSSALIDCLRGVDAYDLVLAQHQLYYVWSLDPIIPFRPVVEGHKKGAFIPDHPINTIKNGESANVPYIFLINTQEGALRSPGIIANDQLLKDFNTNYTDLYPVSLLYQNNTNDVNTVTKKVREFYFDNKQITNDKDKDREQLTDLYTDRYFLTPTSDVVDLYRKYSTQPVYYGRFGYQTNVSYSALFGDPNHDYGVSHMDELLSLFAQTSFFPDYTPSKTSKHEIDIMTTIWTTFAKTGNPNAERSRLRKWKPVRTRSLEYYSFNPDTSTDMREKMYWGRYKFWKSLPIYYDN